MTTNWHFLFAVVWPFIALALFIVFGRILVKRDMAAYLRSEAEKRRGHVKEAAE
jgi:hypothetical protein